MLQLHLLQAPQQTSSPAMAISFSDLKSRNTSHPLQNTAQGSAKIHVPILGVMLKGVQPILQPLTISFQRSNFGSSERRLNRQTWIQLLGSAPQRVTLRHHRRFVVCFQTLMNDQVSDSFNLEAATFGGNPKGLPARKPRNPRLSPGRSLCLGFDALRSIWRRGPSRPENGRHSLFFFLWKSPQKAQNKGTEPQEKTSHRGCLWRELLGFKARGQDSLGPW